MNHHCRRHLREAVMKERREAMREDQTRSAQVMRYSRYTKELTETCSSGIASEEAEKIVRTLILGVALLAVSEFLTMVT